jgi:serine/threonine protein kinase
MSQEAEQPAPEEPLARVLQTRIPGIGDEIQGAINTLRKIQQIAGPGSNPSLDDASVAGATLDGSSAGAAQLLAPSESFGRYQVVRLLGQGNMGAVYLAYDPRLERHVALKTPFLGSNPTTVERFYREARAAAQLRSPYICTVFDVGQTAGIYFVSMAFIDGQPLDRIIADGKLKDLRRIADITKKIARGLQKAHEQGIMHRDLKPANVMIDSDGEPVVMDFGLARKVDEDTLLTTPGKILGTPAYMSPEQVEGDPKNIGHSTDIYSLGVVLYQMLTGRVPFQGSFTSILRNISSERPQKPSSINPDLAVDAPLERICLKMMAKSAAERFPTMATVAEALDEAFPPEGAVVVQPSAWDKLRSATKGLFGFLGRKPSPAKVSVPDTGKPAPDLSGTQLTATSDSMDRVEKPAPVLDATQMTGTFDSVDKPGKPTPDLDATQMTMESGSVVKPVDDISATQNGTEY